jgi:hypothetical protein
MEQQGAAEALVAGGAKAPAVMRWGIERGGGELKYVLTGGGCEGEPPKQAGGGRPGWPARSARGGGAPALPGQRGEAGDAQLDGLELLVVLARVEGRRKPQIVGGGGELDTGGGGSGYRRRRRGAQGARHAGGCRSSGTH